MTSTHERQVQPVVGPTVTAALVVKLQDVEVPVTASGADTASCSTVGFNGFARLITVLV